jgi:hypothetical protein
VVAVRRGVDESCEHQSRPERSATHDPVNYSDAAKELFTELRRLWREQGDDLVDTGHILEATLRMFGPGLFQVIYRDHGESLSRTIAETRTFIVERPQHRD